MTYIRKVSGQYIVYKNEDEIARFNTWNKADDYARQYKGYIGRVN